MLRGDSAFVCDYKSGNCSDLHSYLISLSRSLWHSRRAGIRISLDGHSRGQSLADRRQDNRVSLLGSGSKMLKKAGFRWTPPTPAGGLTAGKSAVADSLFGSLVLERSAVAVSRGRDLTLSRASESRAAQLLYLPIYAEANGKSVPASWNLTYHVISGSGH